MRATTIESVSGLDIRAFSKEELLSLRDEIDTELEAREKKKESRNYDILRYESIKANATQSYFRLMAFLVFLVEGVKTGFPLHQDLVDFANRQ